MPNSPGQVRSHIDNGGKVVLSLMENAIHSYTNGKKKLSAFNKNQNQWDLKEAILYIHNGMELLLKHILAEQNEFLIFEDVNEASKSKIKAKEQGVNIFELNKPPNTVKFASAISRVKSIYDGSETDIFGLLEELNKLRNQIQHYGGQLNTIKTYELLESLTKKSSNLFSHFNIKIAKLENTVEGISSITNHYVRNEKELLTRLITLMQKFNGQSVDPNLFSRSGDAITLPKFTEIDPYISTSRSQFINLLNIDLVDIQAIDVRNNMWLVELKMYSSHSKFRISHLEETIQKLAQTGNIVWLVIWSAVPRALINFTAQMGNVYVSGMEQIERLEKELLR